MRHKLEPEICRVYKNFLLPFLLPLKIEEAWLWSVTGSEFHLKKRNFLLLEQTKEKETCLRKYQVQMARGPFILVPDGRFLRESTDTQLSCVLPLFQHSQLLHSYLCIAVLALCDAREAILLGSSFLLHALPNRDHQQVISHLMLCLLLSQMPHSPPVSRKKSVDQGFQRDDYSLRMKFTCFRTKFE